MMMMVIRKTVVTSSSTRIMNAQKPRVNTAQLPLSSAISPTSSTDGGSISPLLPAFVPRPTVSRHTTSQSLSFPPTRSAALTPQVSTSNVAQAHGKRLLMPMVRPVHASNPSPPPKLQRFSPVKHSRSRAGSLAQTMPPSPDPNSSPPTSVDWIGSGCRFEVVEEQLELSGYQMYAVEKW
jgi:hypothetical protein